VTRPEMIASAIREFRPDVLINAAAYTAVDRAESDSVRAFSVNADGARHVAEAAAATGARVVHISTDYVFDGKRSCPYETGDKPSPIGVYGASKAEGERMVLATHGEAIVIRTSWLYSARGQSFLSTILRLLKEKQTLRIVSDQIGVPTACRDLADAIWQCIAKGDAQGILHWTNAGIASWYDFAVAIQEIALAKSILGAEREIVPIRSSEYPVAAPRPCFSVLDSTATWRLLGSRAAHWRTALAQTMEEMREDV
jgi:dTDP-4-dehydrorhamnose reductase